MSRISTRGGDKGQTGDGCGRIFKDDLKMEVVGSLDELSCFLGLARCRSKLFAAEIEAIQQLLLRAGADVCQPGRREVTPADLAGLERLLDEHETGLAAGFVLPGADETSASLHVCRAVARRLERRLVALKRRELSLNPDLLCCINRLSDLLFVMAERER